VRKGWKVCNAQLYGSDRLISQRKRSCSSKISYQYIFIRCRQRQSRYITPLLDTWLIIQDPGQLLVSKLSLRTNKEYSNPAIYGTITGAGFKASTEPMRDGGIDFGSKSAAGKKKEEPIKKGKKDEKEVKAPVKEDTKTRPPAKGEKESQPKPAKSEPEVAEPVSWLRIFGDDN
jgi:hypothetical protein